MKNKIWIIYFSLVIMVLSLMLIIWVSLSRAMEIKTNSFDIPKGNCKQGEVYRCVMGQCFSTLLYCPPVYEDGKLISNTNCNKTTCTWNCECVKKDKQTDTEKEWPSSISTYNLDNLM